jgi:nucleoside-diphosphate-sugar epimerase
MISVFGSTGFIGSKWMNLYSENSYSESRDSIKAQHKDILYFRATNSNYNVYSDPSIDVETNLILLTKLFKNIDSSNNFNLISSWFVYGKNNCEINREINYCNPKGFYSITKYTQEQLTESYCETNNINYKILRLCNVIGGDQKATAKKNALEFLIDKLKKHEELNIYEGDNYRNYLNVEDICIAINLINQKGPRNQIYNIGDTKSTKLMDIIDYCKNKLNSKSVIKIIETPKFHEQVQTKNFWMDTSKLQSLGFKPKYSLEQTLNILCK